MKDCHVFSPHRKYFRPMSTVTRIKRMSLLRNQYTWRHIACLGVVVLCTFREILAFVPISTSRNYQRLSVLFDSEYSKTESGNNHTFSNGASIRGSTNGEYHSFPHPAETATITLASYNELSPTAPEVNTWTNVMVARRAQDCAIEHGRTLQDGAVVV